MGMFKIKEKDYSDGRTKQAFKDQCDINKILKKAQQTGSITHLQKYPEMVYGEFDGEFDLLTAQNLLARGGEIFADLPSETRREFNNNPAEYLAFVNNPENRGRLKELLPELAKPGNFFPNPVARGRQGAGAANPEPELPASQPASEPASPPAGDPPPSGGGSSD